MDVSSYEYYISLLCQALRIDDAKAIIADMKKAYEVAENGKASTASNDQSVTEALALVYLALGRSHAILGERNESIASCKQSLSFAEISRVALKSDNSFSRECCCRAMF